jgi:hypothetical protein
MRKKRNTRSRAIKLANWRANWRAGWRGNRRADIAVVFACLLGAAVCIGLFQADLNRTLRRLNESPVGTVVFKSRAALRRFQDRIIWDRLRKEAAVYNGDFIRTADRSEAAIRFPGGEQINLLENSLIRIFVEAGVPQVDFSRGNISVYTQEGGGLSLSFGENRVKVASGAVVSLGAPAEGEAGLFSLQVAEGSAALITAGGEREAAAGTALFLNAEGTGEIPAEPRASVLVPPPAARILTPEDAAVPVEFIWNNQTVSGDTRIEIARDRDFTQSLMVLEANPPEITNGSTGIIDSSGGVIDNSSGVILAIPPGTWWWRVYSPDLTGDAGGRRVAGQLTVVRTSPPEPVSPLPAAAYYYRTDPPELRFQWKVSDEALFYVLEAADNPGMANPALRAEVRYNSLVYSQLTEGQWYWRVTPVFPAFYQGKIPSSPVVPFTISRGDPPVQTPGALAAAAEELPETAGTATVVSATVVPAAEPPGVPAPAEARAGPHPERAAAEPPPRPSGSRRENTPPPPLPAAVGRRPENDYVIGPETLGESRTIVFSWDPVEGADAYIFTLLGENNSGVRRSITVAEGAETSYTLNDLSLLDRGRFIWQVEAVSRGTDGTIGRRGTPGENRFTVDIPQPPPPRGKDVGVLYGR